MENKEGINTTDLKVAVIVLWIFYTLVFILSHYNINIKTCGVLP